VLNNPAACRNTARGRALAAAGLAFLLVACGAPKSRQSAAQAPLAPGSPPRTAAAYRIDPQASELRILVYRAGVMALLGHNHVIVNRALEGSASFAGTISSAAFSLTVPVEGFVVDDPEPRREEGPDFAEETPPEAKSGTLHNMLSPALLDAANYPAITLRSVSLTQSSGAIEATVALSVAGHESRLVVPFHLDTSPGRLSASGELTVRQSAIGLTPFSVFLGALKVQDELRVKFKIVATAN
jgi:hypothetical protein